MNGMCDINMKEFFSILEVQYILRMILACMLGVLIGYERKVRSKEAGIRTHSIVCCAAALMMIISKYGFFDLVTDNHYTNADIRLGPSRVASQIVTAVGFLGTGMIFVDKRSISGLTTAAGVWATTGIGMAVGAGMYAIGIAGTVIILLAQIVLHTNAKWLHNPKTKILKVRGVGEKYFQDYAINLLKNSKITVLDTNIKHYAEKGVNDYEFIIELPATVTETDVCGFFQYDSSIASN